MVKLAEPYEAALAEKLKVAGYDRAARGRYARSENAIVWHGLHVSFYRKGGMLNVQPTLGIFCPKASKIVKKGLDEINPEYPHPREKLGDPFINYFLYDRARILSGADRLPYSYDVGAVDQVDGAVGMIWKDFSKVADRIFNCTSTMRELRDRIVTESPLGTGTGRAMDAMALTYLIDETMAAADVDRLAKLHPCPMTTKFGDYMKKKIKVARSS